MRRRSAKAAPPAPRPTRVAASFLHTTGTSAIRNPRRRATKSASTSNEKPSRRVAEKEEAAAAAVNSLKPHCVSCSPGNRSPCTSRLKTRPIASR
jgi:hypothetical protein